MPTLAELKASHPEWCLSCGKWHLEPGGIHTCFENPLIATLTAAKLEDEAEIAELKKDLWTLKDRMVMERKQYLDAIAQAVAPLREAIALMPPPPMHLTKSESTSMLTVLNTELRSQLSAEQAAHQQLEAKLELLAAEHATTKEELRKADEALVHNWEAHPELSFKDYAERDAAFESYQTALARQAQRAADAAKEE